MIIPLLKKFWISIFLCITILILCFMNTEPLPKIEMTDFDKLVHYLMFLGLSGTIFFENTKWFRKRISNQRIFWGSFLFPTLFSGAIELMQEYLAPTRSGDWMDFFFDGLGTLTGLVLCWLINLKITNYELRIRN